MTTFDNKLRKAVVCSFSSLRASLSVFMLSFMICRSDSLVSSCCFNSLSNVAFTSHCALSIFVFFLFLFAAGRILEPARLVVVVLLSRAVALAEAVVVAVLLPGAVVVAVLLPGAVVLAEGVLVVLLSIVSILVQGKRRRTRTTYSYSGTQLYTMKSLLLRFWPKEGTRSCITSTLWISSECRHFISGI